MRINTSRFGTLDLLENELFNFPAGLIGLESLKVWSMVPDPTSESVAWLQSVSRASQAVAVISPRAFVPGYRASISSRDLALLGLRSDDRVYVVSTISGNAGRITTNLQAPILINLDRRVGIQVVATDQQPLRYALEVPYQQRLAA